MQFDYAEVNRKKVVQL